MMTSKCVLSLGTAVFQPGYNAAVGRFTVRKSHEKTARQEQFVVNKRRFNYLAKVS